MSGVARKIWLHRTPCFHLGNTLAGGKSRCFSELPFNFVQHVLTFFSLHPAVHVSFLELVIVI
jgi:hypothetical protein